MVYIKRLPNIPIWVIDWGAVGIGDWGTSLWETFNKACLGMPRLDPVQQSRIRNGVLAITGTICDQVQILAPMTRPEDDGGPVLLSEEWKGMVAEVFRFDMTKGSADGEIKYSLDQPAIARGHASLMLCLSDRDPIRGTRYTMSSSFLTHVFTYLDILEACEPGGMASMCQEDLLKTFIGENLNPGLYDIILNTSHILEAMEAEEFFH